MSRPFDLVMFDLDGTLVATAPEICAAVNDTLREQDWPEVSLQQVEPWIGQGTRELLIHALAHVRGWPLHRVRDSDDFPAMLTQFGQHYAARCATRSEVFPEVCDVLESLHAQGVPLAVVTNKEYRHAKALLNAHGLDRWFDWVIGGDTLSTRKPDPAGVWQCLHHFGVTMQRALLVGDSSIDAATGRNAGITVWLVPYGYNGGQPIGEAHPHRILDSFSQITSIFFESTVDSVQEPQRSAVL